MSLTGRECLIGVSAIPFGAFDLATQKSGGDENAQAERKTQLTMKGWSKFAAPSSIVPTRSPVRNISISIE
jgi:hypothetical protein